MGTKIEVLSAEVEKVVGTKGANKGVEFAIPKAQCILHIEDASGVKSRKVGVLGIPKGVELPKPGFYTAVMELNAGFDGRIEPQLRGLTPVPPTGR